LVGLVGRAPMSLVDENESWGPGGGGALMLGSRRRAFESAGWLSTLLADNYQYVIPDPRVKGAPGLDLKPNGALPALAIGEPGRRRATVRWR
jgi:hypothetical protein